MQQIFRATILSQHILPPQPQREFTTPTKFISERMQQ